MKLGVNLGYLGITGTVSEDLAFAVAAEQLGYDSIWVGEPYGHEAASVLGWLAAATERVTLGSAVFVMPGRSPAMTAQTAATLDTLSESRFVLGLGSSGPQVSEGWHGVPFANQLQRTREYIEVIRMAIRRERVVYSGETIELPLPGGEGRALKMILTPPREEIPIYLAALGPRNLELCGEIADGWLPLWFAPEHAARLRAPLERGAERTGRSVSEIAICPSVTMRIDEDLDRARALMRPPLALYIGGMGSKDRNFYKRLIESYGYEDVCERIQDLYLAGEQGEAGELIPDELIDLVCLCGPLDRVTDRLGAYEAVGLDTLIAIPAAFSQTDRIEQLRLLMEAREKLRPRGSEAK